MRPYLSLMTRQNCYSLAETFWFICHIHQTLYLWMSIYFGLYKILLMGKKIQFPGKELFAQNDKKFWEDGIIKVAWKIAESSGAKQWIFCSVKFFMKMKNESFIFTWTPKNFLANLIEGFRYIYFSPDPQHFLPTIRVPDSSQGITLFPTYDSAFSFFPTG